MSSRVIYCAAVALTFVLACDELNEDFIERPSPVVSQSVTSRTPTSVIFKATAVWGNSCGRFSSATVFQIDSTYYIRVFGQEPRDAVCLTVMTTFDGMIAMSGIIPRRYTFKFWQSDTTSLDTTIVFP